MSRKQQVERITYLISQGIATDLGGDFDFAAVERENARGWTIELPSSLGNVTRHEGVVLTTDELRTAWEKAQA